MIEILNVSKKFMVSENRSRDLKETAINFLKGKKHSFREVWALRGINLKIAEGESVAFIGENGSGKSTLLKLLCGIYAPDEGRILKNGKLSALLELGVGFHPDLTGEENIFLNGSLLGFNRKEMKRRFDEIVSFSEIENFIYSPIRTYSSGMIMRLAFSIATCVDPDILLIDEVLAVGDEAFQKKCLKRMEEFRSAGKTIVIVSHALDIVRKFSDRIVLLHEGRVSNDGVSGLVIDKYHAILSSRERPPDLNGLLEEERLSGEATLETGEARTLKEKKGESIEDGEEKKTSEGVPQIPKYERYGTLEAVITGVVIKSERGEEADSFVSGEMIAICLHIRFHREIEDPIVGIAITMFDNGRAILIYNTNTRWRNINLGVFERGVDIEVDFIQKVPFPEGEYYLNAAIANSDGSMLYEWKENLKCFQIKTGPFHWEGTMDLDSQIVIHK